MRSPRSPRQERSRRTQEALLDAVEAFGVDKTYDQITVQEIASRAGFTVGALYARFPSKSALLHGLMDRYEALVDKSKAHLKAVDAGDQLVEHLAAELVAAYRSSTGRMRLLESAVQADETFAKRFEITRATTLDFIIETLGRAYPLSRHDLEAAALLLVMPLRELYFKREFWPRRGRDAADLTDRVVVGVIAFLDACRAKATRRPS